MPMPPYFLGHCGASQPRFDSFRLHGFTSCQRMRRGRWRISGGHSASMKSRTIVRNSASVIAS
jgi:hypothetical protein